MLRATPEIQLSVGPHRRPQAEPGRQAAERLMNLHIESSNLLRVCDATDRVGRRDFVQEERSIAPLGIARGLVRQVPTVCHN
eukprot:COSAG06_NODE_984_length_11197_cov_75.225806_3_plen_82_part_00